MKPSPESPELTAYLLGELPEVHRAELEAAVASDPNLQRELASLGETMTRVQDALDQEPLPELAAVQRDWIEEQLSPHASEPTSPRPKRSRWTSGSVWMGWGFGVAASCVAALWFGHHSREKAQDARMGATPIRLSNVAPGAPAVTRPVESTAVATSGDTPSRHVTANEESKVAGRGGEIADRPTASEVALVGSGVEAVPAPDAAEALSAPAGALSAPVLEPALARRYGLRMERADAGLGGDSRPPSVDSSARMSPGPNRSVPSGGRSRSSELRPSRPSAASSTVSKAPWARGDGKPDGGIPENVFQEVSQTPLSTFGLDVDTASYANVRRFLREGHLPPKAQVRIEELVNYFSYQLPSPKGDDPFGVLVEVADCPWNRAHRLIRIALKSREIPRQERSRANLVFLIDVSGSMAPEDRLPLVKRSLRLLVDQLHADDRVSLVTYAGEAGVVLEPTSGSDPNRIRQAVDQLSPGGSTHGSAGIEAAYALARRTFQPSGINRVILCTDGDFNVGTTSRAGLLSLIREQAMSGVFLTVLGFGTDSYQDATAELLADRGNGNYAYIDSFAEARKVLREQIESTLITVAKDAKVQIEFNPAKVRSWRLLGYENRVLADRDFKDDSKDAGDVGAGQAVNMLYEVIPAGGIAGLDTTEPLRYQQKAPEVARPGKRPAAVKNGQGEELLFLKLRYKRPEGSQSTEWSTAVMDNDRSWDQMGADFRFSAAVAGYGMLLGQSEFRGELTYELVLQLAQGALGSDAEGYRAEFIDLARLARKIARQP